MGFAQATQKYLQGLHNVLRHFVHDKINTALPKHSFAGKKKTDPEQKQTNNSKNNNKNPHKHTKQQNKNQKLVSYLELWKEENMYRLGRILVADEVI